MWYSLKQSFMHSPTLQSMHSYLDLERFLSFRTDWLQTTHVSCFGALPSSYGMSDGKWRSISRFRWSLVAFRPEPTILQYFSINCRINSIRNSPNVCLFFLFFIRYMLYAFKTVISRRWKKSILYHFIVFLTHSMKCIYMSDLSTPPMLAL